MSDKLVEVAAYSIPLEAHAARGLLEAEGIRSVLCGEQTVVMLGIQGITGQITLNVAESDAERAAALLAQIEDGPPPDDSRLWLCPLCGDAVDVDRPTCPACETPRPESWQVRMANDMPQNAPDSREIQHEPPRLRPTITSDTPIEAVPWAREEEDEPASRELSVVNDRARAAWGRFATKGLLLLVALGFVLLLWLVFGLHH